MNFKPLSNESDLSIRLILDSLRKMDPLTTQLLELLTQERSIKNVCKKVNMSRFRVKRRISKGLRYMRNIIKREGI
jgi:AraC-like DNA-binding protein